MVARTFQQCIFTSIYRRHLERQRQGRKRNAAGALATGAVAVWLLYPETDGRGISAAARCKKAEDEKQAVDGSAWSSFASAFERLTGVVDVEWAKLSDAIVSSVVPDWSKFIPGQVRKLQRELSMAPGSLADEIWREAHDPEVNPEIRYQAKVRVSSGLCAEELEFRARRKKVAKIALARYLGMDERDVHPDDVPTMAMCGSGGGLRALVAGTGSMLAAEEDGLVDCLTYMAGVSGSCWLQALAFSSIGECSMARVLNHLKTRTGIHIAYPPVALDTLGSLPTSKYLLSGLVEKLKGDEKAAFGLVDIYGLLLAARYLIPHGVLDVNGRDFKLSNQREYIRFGQNPLPVYTAVHHVIPAADLGSDKEVASATEAEKEKAKQEAWFQWFEITPYEFFCEEFSAGIPTWALGRRFNNGVDVPPESGFHLPEVRVPLLMGVFGSAFCATLSHYYREIQPIVRSMTGFGAVDEMIAGRNEDLSRVHPIDPATMPNFVYGMHGKLPRTTPESILDQEHVHLMDAGMSNNLPIYPLLRPGRGVDIIIAFDASADIKQDNWLSVTDGYARQRGISGWPVGIGWPKGEPAAQAAKELGEAQAATMDEAKEKVEEAGREQASRRATAARDGSKPSLFKGPDEKSGDLGYCTVWVGTTQEREADPPPPTKAIDDSSRWRLSDPAAGLTMVYLPLLPNPQVPGVDPLTTDFLSTWNFVYTPEQVDQVAALAKANYGEGKEQIRATVRAVYERKKKAREDREEREDGEQYGQLVRKGLGTKLGEGDHFS
jgi:cytosolic phospholipase A2